MKQMPDQMPGILAKLDDPWGINWRVANFIKRLSWRRAFRFLWGYLCGVCYERPVFVIGVPRSGTTLLFELLRTSDELGALPREGHDLWRTYHHPRYGGWRSDAIGKGQVRFGERRFVNAYLYAYAITSRRFVEKTPENSLRVPYLLELFPDATFVVVRRNPCDVINSLINGWRHPAGRYRSYYVPHELHIQGYPHRRRWCFALIEDWRGYVMSPIHHIAFAQWAQCTEALLAARELVPRSQWIEVYLERLLANPDETLLTLCNGVGIQHTPALKAKLAHLIAEPVNALSPPGVQKWRRENTAEIMELLPKVVPAAYKTGYLVDVETGNFEVRLS